jgi:hypothetical protein
MTQTQHPAELALNDLERLLETYMPDKEDRPAINAVIDVYAFIQCCQLNIAGKAEPALARLAARSMMAFMIGWQANPFITRHGAAFMQAAAQAVGAAFDAMSYRDLAAAARDERDNDAEHRYMARASSCANEITNVALAAVTLQKGVGFARKNAVKLRNAMWDLPARE